MHNTKNIPQKQVSIQLNTYKREKLLNQTAWIFYVLGSSLLFTIHNLLNLCEDSLPRFSFITHSFSW